MSKRNCWEIKNCGLQPGGDIAKIRGVCPAAVCEEYDGVNHGLKAGRFCWAVAGTMCEGRVQGIFAMKIETCLQCEVFRAVSDEMGPEFTMHPDDCNRPDVDTTTCDRHPHPE
ncbi:MAG: two-CW domain-containing protein [bacterium]